MEPQSPYATYRSPITQRQWLTQRRVLFQELGDHNYVVPVGGNIQEAIDRAAAQGGGIIRLNDGTHSPTTSLTVPSKTPIQFLGINMTTTIVDFGSTTNRFILAGENIYTTGTVSITNGVTLTGSSTAWLTSGLVAGDEIFLDSRWYKISAIAGDTTIILSEGYGGAALSGATYRAGSIVRDVEFTELTVKNCTSASGAIDIDDGRNILFEDVQVVTCNVGISTTNFSEFDTRKAVVAGNSGDGVVLNTGSLINCSSLASAGNGGVGLSLTSVSTGTFAASAFDGNTGIGVSVTGGTNLYFQIAAQSNGSDGLKLVSTTDYCKIIGGHFAFNGGYGVNIAASTCDNNHLALSTFNTNTSGTYNDSGTNTVLVGV